MSTQSHSNGVQPGPKGSSSREAALSIAFAVVFIASLVIYLYWPAWLFTPRAPRVGEFMGVFQINPDGTVTDLRTGLVWQREITKIDTGWRTDTVPPGDSCYAGACDWRVPTLAELNQLLEGIGQVQAAWRQQLSRASPVWAALVNLCDSRSFLCLSNPLEHSATTSLPPVPFENVTDPVLAGEVKETTERYDEASLYTTWDMQVVNLATGQVTSRSVTYYEGPPIAAFTGRCVVNCTNYTWHWLLVRQPAHP